MYEIVGRLLVRKGKIMGLFIPMGKTHLEQGIYDVKRIMGEITLNRIGMPAMPETRFNALDVGGLCTDPSAVMTAAEWTEARRGS